MLTHALVLALLLQAAPAAPVLDPAPVPTPAPLTGKPAGALPSLDVAGAVVVTYTAKTGPASSNLSLGALALAAHWGPFYVGGTMLDQSSGGTTSAGVVYFAYCGQGYYRGWFRGVVIAVGQRLISSDPAAPKAFFVSIGVGK